MARFEIQEGIAKTRHHGGGQEGRGSTKLWQVEDGRPPWRSVVFSRSRRAPGIRYRVTRVAGAEIEERRIVLRSCACNHECLGTIYPDNIATGTLFTYNEMHIVAAAVVATAASCLLNLHERRGRGMMRSG